MQDARALLFLYIYNAFNGIIAERTEVKCCGKLDMHSVIFWESLMQFAVIGDLKNGQKNGRKSIRRLPKRYLPNTLTDGGNDGILKFYEVLQRY